MKILLVNAPGGSHFDGPMMGIPSVMGQLTDRSETEVRQRDLDLELFYHTLRPDTLQRILDTLEEKSGRLEARSSFLKGLFVRLLGRLALRWLARRGRRDREFMEAFRAATPIDRQFPEEGLLRYKKAVNRVLKLMAVFFYPYLAYPRFFSLGEKKRFARIDLRIAHALAERCVHGRRALEDFYDAVIIPPIREEGYDVVGLSISFKRQLEPALILAQVIKKRGIEAKIVLGGSYITTVLDADWFEDTILEHADFVVCYEGEEAFRRLLEALEAKGPLEEVPNLVFLHQGKQVRTKQHSIMDMNTLKRPDYGGLPLDRYLERPVRLPLMTCRGCYWGRCTYCSHHWTLGSGRHRARSPDLLFEDIVAFQDRYGTKSLYFTDESIHPPTMDALAARIVEAGLTVRWVGMLRFDESVDHDFLKRMRDSGCHAIMFGLESVSEHVQKIINKGIRLERAYRILEHCHDLGIRVHLFIILGIPGEREEDMAANLDFLMKKAHLYETVQLAPFQLMKGSPMYRHPEKFGIEGIETVSHADRLAYSELRFETREGLSRVEAQRITEVITKDKVLFEKDLWEGFGYRLYREVEPSRTPGS
jgi:radical SAM superfamily enzyme YgiQ (UPF0313 family)